MDLKDIEFHYTSAKVTAVNNGHTIQVNPVDYMLDSIRTVIITGWERSAIMPGLWVLVGMSVLLLVNATWIYRRETA